METLARLEKRIQDRRGADPAISYVAKLFRAGRPKIAQKLGEEAVETVIAAMQGDKARLASESADLLYHLLVVLAVGGVPLEAVMAELEGRTGRTGIAEKASRG